MAEQWNNDGETVKERWWNSRTMMVEQLNREGGIVQQ